MHTSIQKWGNSLATRIPASLANELHLTKGTPVSISIVSGKLVIKPDKPLSLDDLLDGITPENLHTAVDWGEPQGREVL